MKLNYGQQKRVHALTSLDKQFRTTLVKKHCEDWVYCPHWWEKEPNVEKRQREDRERPVISTGGAAFFPRGSWERRLWASTQQDANAPWQLRPRRWWRMNGGQWVGGWCFQRRGGGETENWVWLTWFRGGRSVEGENTRGQQLWDGVSGLWNQSRVNLDLRGHPPSLYFH